MLTDRKTVMSWVEHSYTCCFDYLTRYVLKSQESKNRSAVKWKQHATLIRSRVHEWLVVSLHVPILAAQIWGILWDHVQMDLFLCFLCVHQPTRDRESAQLAASIYRPYENSIESEYPCYDIGGGGFQRYSAVSKMHRLSRSTRRWRGKALPFNIKCPWI